MTSLQVSTELHLSQSAVLIKWYEQIDDYKRKGEKSVEICSEVSNRSTSTEQFRKCTRDLRIGRLRSNQISKIRRSPKSTYSFGMSQIIWRVFPTPLCQQSEKNPAKTYTLREWKEEQVWEQDVSRGCHLQVSLMVTQVTTTTTSTAWCRQLATAAAEMSAPCLATMSLTPLLLQATSQTVLHTDNYECKLKSFPSHKAHRAALISVSLDTSLHCRTTDTRLDC